MKLLLEMSKEGSENLNLTGGEWAMNKLQKKSTYIISNKQIKYLGINLTENVQDLYEEKVKLY